MKKSAALIVLLFLFKLYVFSQEAITVSGAVKDASDKQPIPGVNVFIKGTTTGTITSIDGDYRIEAKMGDILVFSFIGMDNQEAMVNAPTINVLLKSSFSDLEEVVIVGYGVQTKESIVGAIVQTSGEELMKSGGVSTVGQALTGRLPGVTTIASSGRPGDEAPSIYIRGRSTWGTDEDGNDLGQPLVLVDGVERSMNDIDMNDIEKISVLKDASATAVFGVKGANGVILITTKRGKVGRAQLSVSVNSTMKKPAAILEKLDSYNGFRAVNDAIERQVSFDDQKWSEYTPIAIMENYRGQDTQYLKERYPNIDWADYILKEFAFDQRVNVSVRGGNDFAKYFGSVSYQHVGDVFKGGVIDNGRNYNGDLSYDRYNFRSNVDFDITTTTRFSVNLSGSYAIQNSIGASGDQFYTSLYSLGPSSFYPQYSDGSYGNFTSSKGYETSNPAVTLGAKGATQQHKVQVNSDFSLDQKLDFILNGLSLKASLSYDNNYSSGAVGVKEPNPTGYDNVIYKIYDDDGTYYYQDPGANNQFDYVIAPWYREPLDIDDWETTRRLFYQFTLNYNKTFAGVHNLSVLALMNREEYAKGSMLPRYREDWVSRVTYNYDTRYFFDINGAYNGSEKFGPDNRFELFPSVALGWMISNESFMKTFDWLDKLKVRGSFGLVGDDSVGQRWGYISQWTNGGTVAMDNTAAYWGSWMEVSAYTLYREDVLGNPDLKWETAEKMNVGFEVSALKNMFSLEFDYFNEERNDIIIQGSERNMPGFYGIIPADANLGKSKVSGIELALGFRYKINHNWDVWADVTYSRSKDKIVYMENPQFRDNYRKEEGYAIGLPKVQIQDDFMTSWDNVYASASIENEDYAKRPGYWSIVDFNSDGVINSEDAAPYGFPTRPENNYNFSLGFGFKNLTFMAQFHGVKNVMVQYQDRTFVADQPLFFEFMDDYWTVDNPDGEYILPNYGELQTGATDSYRQWYDGSYLKLQNVEIGYTLKTKGSTMYKFTLSGNELHTWSHMPDERQVSHGLYGFYPTFRRFSLGLNINF